MTRLFTLIRLAQTLAALTLFFGGLAMLVASLYSGWNFDWDTEAMRALGFLLFIVGGFSLLLMSDDR